MSPASASPPPPATDAARRILANHGFTPTREGYALPVGTDETRQLGAVVQAETALSMGEPGHPYPARLPHARGHPRSSRRTSSHTATPPAAPVS
ncbi:hypothetical protein [Streptomyces rimosus]|uniref:hypothetical protein n=1 Tax=Streptomyces rimosus TaxID=1927 RepID=UPI00311E942F